MKHVRALLRGRVLESHDTSPIEFRPRLYRTNDDDDIGRLEREVLSRSEIAVSDTLLDQLADLAEAREPTKKREGEARRQAAMEMAERQGGLDRCGTWVFYPWLRALVRVLPERELKQLRSFRNLYKITPEAQARLGAGTIGIVGLSVGQASAITLVLQGIGASFRLADPDGLGLTNMNRLRASLADLGLNKCVIAARQMAEIDPYLNIEIFEDGLHDANMAVFLGGDSTSKTRLDLLIEESDDLYIKVLARERARALRIPVLMETNDRGMLDVERFDLEPERPLLHGLLGDVDARELRGLSTTEKVPYLFKFLDPDVMSLTMRGSLFEIDQTITGWPQLASGVALGGALIAEAARRVLTNSSQISGRFFVDLDADLADERATLARPAIEPPREERPAPTAITAPSRARASYPPSDEDIRRIVGHGILAPSGGNVQPWKFVAKHGEIACFVDAGRSGSLLDFERTATHLALGAAVENMTIAALAMGLDTHIEGPDDRSASIQGDRERVCTLRFSRSTAPADPLAEVIADRATNRRLGERAPLSEADLAALGEAARVRGSTIQILTRDEDLDAAGEMLADGDLVRFFSSTLHRDMMHEMRWTAAHAEATGDGVDARTLELSAADFAGMRLAATPEVIAFLGRIGGGAALRKSARKAIAASSAVALITTPGTDRAAYFLGGRAAERVWLTATARGLAVQPWSPLTYLFARLERGDASAQQRFDAEATTATGAPSAQQRFDADDVARLREVRRAYLRLFDVPRDHAEVFLIRIGRAAPPTARALRRPLDDVLRFEQEP